MAYVDDGIVSGALPPGVHDLYTEWMAQVGEVGGWGEAQHFEAALWEARGRLADELLVGYPRAIVLGGIADRLASAFGGYGGRERGGRSRWQLGIGPTICVSLQPPGLSRC